MMKSNRFIGSVLLFCILFLPFGQCHAQQYSPEFQALLNQVQQAYLTPRGENLSSMRNQSPSIVAALMGHALRQQMVHVQQNHSLNNRFKNLQQEARVYITDLARTTSYRGRNEDGSPLTPESLWFVVDKVFQGQEDGLIFQHFGVRTGTMPSVLAARPGPQPPRRPAYDPLEKTEEKSQIDLLGRVAPPVKGPPKETQPPPPPPRQVTLNPDGIQGIWYSENSVQLKIWKEGDTYLGMLTNRQGYVRENWRSNEVCLRLKYVGRDEGTKAPWVMGTLFFKGKHNTMVGNPLANNYEWQDKTSHYEVRSDGVETFGAILYSISETTFKRNPR
jgi:hypothetical protein